MDVRLKNNKYISLKQMIHKSVPKKREGWSRSTRSETRQSLPSVDHKKMSLIELKKNHSERGLHNFSSERYLSGSPKRR